MKVLLLTVAVPELSRPPPLPKEPLPVKVLPITVAVPPLRGRRRRCRWSGVAGEGAAAYCRCSALRVEDAAAEASAELLVKVLPLTVSVPPNSLARPPPKNAELLEKTLLMIVNVPELSMPPPWPLAALPPAIVMPESLTVTLASTVKMRKSGVPEALLRATVRLAAPGPSMSVKPVVLLRSGRAELSVIVPGDCEVDRVIARGLVDLGDGIPQVPRETRAGALVSRAVDGEGGQQRRSSRRSSIGRRRA